MKIIKSIFGLLNSSGVQINPATYDAQTDGSHKTQIVDSAGDIGLISSNGSFQISDEIYAGMPQIINQPYLYAIAEGNITGHELFEKYGYIAAVTTEATIAPLGGDYVFPAAETQMSIRSSDNTQDKPAGTGALTVHIHYLDDTYAAKTTTVILNGTTWVDLSVSDTFRINDMHVATVGTGGKNLGNITLADTATKAINYSYISAGRNHDRQAVYTVPLGKTLYITHIRGSAVNTASNKSCRIILLATYNSEDGMLLDAGKQFYPYYEAITDGGMYPDGQDAPIKFIAKSDIKFNAVSTGTSIVAVTLSGWEE